MCKKYLQGTLIEPSQEKSFEIVAQTPPWSVKEKN